MTYFESVVPVRGFFRARVFDSFLSLLFSFFLTLAAFVGGARGQRSLPPRDACGSCCPRFVGYLPPLGGVGGGSTSGSLDVTGRTDTKGVGRGSRGCILPPPRVCCGL